MAESIPGMLLVDMSGLVFSTVLDYHSRTKESIDMQVLRNLVLERLIFHKNKFRSYSEIVLCFDGRDYWRKKVFPFYKANRAKTRKESTFDWDSFFKLYTDFKQELIENFPVKCLEVRGAEADDLIAILCNVYGPHRDICILSSDKDLVQLQQNVSSKIKQWSFFHKKFITPKNAEYDLFEHIICGDIGDGVPNFLSDDDVLVNPDKRQKSIKKASLAIWKCHGIALPEKFCPTFESLERFNRNKRLVDLREIPEEIAVSVMEVFDKLESVTGRVFNYFMKHRLTRLLANGAF